MGAYELRRGGRPVRIERQPMDLLLLLVERRRQLVSRSEIVDRLWGADVFVDVETGVHTAIRKVRLALHDSPESPTCVETVSGKGYRFIAPVEVVGEINGTPELTAVEPVTAATPPTEDAASVSDSASGYPIRLAAEAAAPLVTPSTRPSRVSLARMAASAAGVIVLLLGAWMWTRTPLDPGPRAALTLAVLPVANLSGDPSREYIAEGLTEETASSLGQIDPEQMGVVARTSTLRYKGTTKSASRDRTRTGR